MSDSDDGHNEPVVLERMENPVAALTDAVLVGTREPLTAPWTRVVSQRGDAVHHASAVPLGRDPFYLFDGGGLDEEPIPCHAF